MLIYTGIVVDSSFSLLIFLLQAYYLYQLQGANLLLKLLNLVLKLVDKLVIVLYVVRVLIQDGRHFREFSELSPYLLDPRIHIFPENLKFRFHFECEVRGLGKADK